MIHEKSEMFAIGAISVALILSVWFNYIEIATMLGGGLCGYIGGQRVNKF